MKRISGLILIFLAPIILLAQALPDTAQKMVSDRINSPDQQTKPYVILISADGFRHDYADKYDARNILNLSSKGIKAEALIPSYPTFTFPNHYTLVTGMHPAHHGVVSNHFYDKTRKEFYSMRNPGTVSDGTWYDGTPLWVLAEQQNMLTASFYWPGSEADIDGVLPSYYFGYNEKISVEKRINTVKKWLELPDEKRPHLITFYFPEVDQAGHRFGPDAPETKKAVQWVDSCIQLMVDEVSGNGLPVNFILVSDHGMTNIDTTNAINLPPELDREKFIIPHGLEIVHLFAKDKGDIPAAYRLLSDQARDYQVCLLQNIKDKLHLDLSETARSRFGDIVLISDWPRVFSLTSRRPNPGGHGYDPYVVPDMNAIFYAWGPSLKEGVSLPPFESIHVFPIITSLLGLDYDHPIDGSASIARQIIK